MYRLTNFSSIYIVFVSHVLAFVLEVYLRVELLDHRVYKILVDTIKHFYKEIVLMYAPTAEYGNFISILTSTLCNVSLFNFCHSGDSIVTSHFGSICTSLKVKVEHFWYVLWSLGFPFCDV